MEGKKTKEHGESTKKELAKVWWGVDLKISKSKKYVPCSCAPRKGKKEKWKEIRRKGKERKWEEL